MLARCWTPICKVTRIEQTAQRFLVARDLYPSFTLVELFDQATMLLELLMVHQENDSSVISAYGLDWEEMPAASCVERFLQMYQRLARIFYVNRRKYYV